MFILLPTCDAYAPIASISLALLRRYWPGHPTVRVLHHANAPKAPFADRIAFNDCGPQEQSGWLETIVRFLQTQREALFILLLDDYAMCGPAKIEAIGAGMRLMEGDPSVGLFPLCWYPARERVARPEYPGIMTLGGAPLLLQAAIWRRTWFLDLASRMDARSTPWSFELAATRLRRESDMKICGWRMPEPRYHGGHLVDGFDKAEWPLPYHNLMHRGEPELSHEGFLAREGFAFPSRGLGDAVAKLARATGIDHVAEVVSQATGRDCGCARRREALNRRFPARAIKPR